MKAFALGLAFASATACTGPVNTDSVREMPTGFLCDILSPNYVSLPSERRTIFSELERRGAECLPSQRIVIEANTLSAQQGR